MTERADEATTELVCETATGVIQADDARFCKDAPTVFVTVEASSVTKKRTLKSAVSGETKDFCIGEEASSYAKCTAVPDVAGCSKCRSDAFVCENPRRQAPMLGLMGKDKRCTTLTTELAERALPLIMKEAAE